MTAWFNLWKRKSPFLLVSILLLSFSGCTRPNDEIPVIPPATHPLAGDYIGFGVVNDSFIHLMSEPGPGGVSRGYLRRGSVVRIVERRPLLNRNNLESWVLTEGNYNGPGSSIRGWLDETNLEIFTSESRANTASRTLNP